MTLLLGLVPSSGIHQSSDYRLVGTGGPVEDIAGNKQLRVSCATWSGDVAFTGIAQVGGLKTRDWISQTISGALDSKVAEVMANLAKVGTQQLQLRALPRDLRKLTIIVTVKETDKPLRLFVISNFDRPDGPPLAQPLDRLAVYEIISSDRPRVFIFGRSGAVAPADRKLLKDLSRRARPAEDIRSTLSAINRRSAKRSHGFISIECMVSSRFADGSSAWENFGRTAGIPQDMIGATKIADVLKRSFKPLPGKKPTVIQGRGVQSTASQVTAAPMNISEGSMKLVSVRGTSNALFVKDDVGDTYTRLPAPLVSGYADEAAQELEPQPAGDTGDVRLIAFSSPTASASITASDGSNLGSIVIGGVSGTAALRKNVKVTAVLNTVTVQLEPAARHQGPPFSLTLHLSNVPTIDRVQPRSWIYTIDVRVVAEWLTCSVRRNSILFRSSNYKSPLPVLANTEELAMTAPWSPLVIKASANTPTASAQIEACYLLRDIPEKSATIVQDPTRPSGRKVGRNEACPCGSGKKYKKCCGRGA